MIDRKKGRKKREKGEGRRGIDKTTDKEKTKNNDVTMKKPLSQKTKKVKTYLPLVLVVLLSLFSLAVSADIIFTFHLDQPNVQSLAFDCTSPNCASVAPTFSGTYLTGPNLATEQEMNISFPDTPATPFGYAIYFVTPGFLPKEVGLANTGAPNSHHSYNINFNRKDVCEAVVQNFSITNSVFQGLPLIINTEASLDAQTASAFTLGGGSVQYVPPALRDEYYSVDTLVTLSIRNHSLGAPQQEVFTETRTFTTGNGNPIFANEIVPVEFTWFPTELGDFSAQITSRVIDNQCIATNDLSTRNEVFPVLPNIPNDECYTILNNVVTTPLQPVVHQPVTVSYTKITNYVDTGLNLHPSETDMRFIVRNASDQVVENHQETIPRNPNPNNPTLHTFTFTPASTGTHSISIFGEGASINENCSIVNNPEANVVHQFPVNSPTLFDLTFQVTAEDTGLPLVGATTTLNLSAQLTDATGSAQFTNLEGGDYLYTVAAAGYTTKSGTVTVSTAGTILPILLFNDSFHQNSNPVINNLQNITMVAINPSLALGGSAVLSTPQPAQNFPLTVTYEGINTANNVVTFSHSGGQNVGAFYFGTEGLDARGTLDLFGQSFRFFVDDLAGNSNIALEQIAGTFPGEATINLDDAVHDGNHGDFELTWSITGQENFSVTTTASRVTTITPHIGFVGNNSLEFNVSDPMGGNDSKIVLAIATGVNTAPTLLDLPNFTMNEGGSIANAFRIADFALDTETNPNNMVYFIDSINDTGLSVTVDNNKFVDIAANPSVAGMFLVTARVSDGLDSATNTFVVNVTNVPQAPQPLMIQNPVALDEDTFSEVDLSAWAYDPDGDPIIYSIQSETTPPFWTIDPASGLWNITPANNFVGNATVNVTFTDNTQPVGLSYVAENILVLINQVNDLPVLTLGTTLGPHVDLAEDTNLTPINLSTIVTDIEDTHDHLIWQCLGNVSAQNVSITTTTPTQENTTTWLNVSALNNFVGFVNVTCIVQDTLGGEVNDSFIINVTNVNDQPSFINPPAVFDAVEDQENLLQFVAEDPDTSNPPFAEIDELVFSDNATFFEINESTGLINFTPTQLLVGLHDVNVTVCDNRSVTNRLPNSCLSHIFIVNISEQDEPPEFNSSNPIPNVTFKEDRTNSSITLTDHFFDEEGNTLTFTHSAVENITVEINATTSVVTFTPDPNFFGIRFINFTANDGTSDSGVSNTIKINVTSVNDPPVLSAITNFTLTEDDPMTFYDLSSFVTDVENDPITFQIINQHSSEVACITTPLTGVNLTPNTNFNGVSNCTVRASDGTDDSAEQLFFIEVNPQNDVPVWVNILTTNVVEDFGVQTLFGDLDVFVSDIDQDPLTFTVVEQNSSELNCSISGVELNFTSIENFFGQASCVVQADDGNGGLANVTIPVSVSAVNDLPVITINLPANESSHFNTDTITFSITATDVEDTTIADENITLTSNLDGNFANGSTNSFLGLSVGEHLITIAATDSEGGSSQELLNITVKDVCPVPVTGDFVVPENETYTCRDRVITVTDDVLVLRNASLILDNVTLNVDDDLEVVEGTLSVQDSLVEVPTGNVGFTRSLVSVQNSNLVFSDLLSFFLANATITDSNISADDTNILQSSIVSMNNTNASLNLFYASGGMVFNVVDSTTSFGNLSLDESSATTFSNTNIFVTSRIVVSDGASFTVEDSNNVGVGTESLVIENAQLTFTNSKLNASGFSVEDNASLSFHNVNDSFISHIDLTNLALANITNSNLTTSTSVSDVLDRSTFHITDSIYVPQVNNEGFTVHAGTFNAVNSRFVGINSFNENQTTINLDGVTGIDPANHSDDANGVFLNLRMKDLSLSLTDTKVAFFIPGLVANTPTTVTANNFVAANTYSGTVFTSSNQSEFPDFAVQNTVINNMSLILLGNLTLDARDSVFAGVASQGEEFNLLNLGNVSFDGSLALTGNVSINLSTPASNLNVLVVGENATVDMVGETEQFALTFFPTSTPGFQVPFTFTRTYPITILDNKTGAPVEGFDVEIFHLRDFTGGAINQDIGSLVSGTTNANGFVNLTVIFNETNTVSNSSISDHYQLRRTGIDTNIADIAIGNKTPLTINYVNQPPTRNTSNTFNNITFEQDNTTIVNLSGLFFDPEGRQLQYFVSQANNVTFDINNSNESVLITPDPGFFGEQFINITAFDGFENTTSENVLLNVTRINFLPQVTVTSPQTGNILPEGPVTFTIVASDPEDGILDGDQVLLFLNNANVANGSSITLPLSPGVYNISATAIDNDLGTTSTPNSTIHINATPRLSTTIQSSFSFPEDTIFTGLNLSVHFSDAENDLLTFTHSPVENLSITFSEGIVTILPDANFSGERNVTFFASDSISTSNASNNVTFTVTPVNDVPFLTRSVGDQLVTINTTLLFTLPVADVENDVLTFSINDSIVGINDTTGLINFTPTNFTNRTVNITVNDGTDDLHVVFDIIVGEFECSFVNTFIEGFGTLNGNFTNVTGCINSRFVDTTVTGPTISFLDAEVNNSVLENITVINSTILNSRIANSTITHAHLTNVTYNNVEFLKGSDENSVQVSGFLRLDPILSGNTYCGFVSILGATSVVRDSNICNISLVDVNIQNTFLRNVNANDTAITQGTINGAELENASVTNASVQNSSLINSGATAGAMVAFSSLTNTQTSGGTYDNVTSAGTQNTFTNATLSDTELNDTTVVDSSASTSTVTTSTIENGSSVSNSTISGSTIAGSTIINSAVSNAVIQNGVILSGVIVSPHRTYDATANGPLNLTEIINYAPVASIQSVLNFNTNEQFIIVSDSTDSNEGTVFFNDTLTYEWDFGNGQTRTTTTNEVREVIYTTPGDFTITLTVKDNNNATSVTSTSVRIEQPQGSGGGGSRSSGGGSSGRRAATFVMNLELGNKTRFVVEDDKYLFNFRGEEYGVEIANVSQTGVMIRTLPVGSATNIPVGNMNLFHLDSDRTTYDLAVTVHTGGFRSAKITFALIQAPASLSFGSLFSDAFLNNALDEEEPSQEPEEVETQEEEVLPVTPPVEEPPQETPTTTEEEDTDETITEDEGSSEGPSPAIIAAVVLLLIIIGGLVIYLIISSFRKDLFDELDSF